MMHILSIKNKTKKRGIEEIDDPDVFYLPLQQHIGAAATPLVSVGERVLKYQLIAEASATISANIHAPASGIIEALAKYPIANGSLVDCIVLRNDFKDEAVEQTPIDIENISPEEILDRIGQAGIVGEGGAQFPTFVKYNLKGAEIQTFIINGTECEPYLTDDYIVMKERTAELFRAIELINRVIGAKEIILSIEKQNKDLIPVFKAYLSNYKNVRVAVLPNEYPQGGELQLIKSLTGKELPKGSLPRNAGIIVSNVGTVHAVYKALFEQKPLTERIITVSGDKAKTIGNFQVKIGTPIRHILEQLDEDLSAANQRFVLGGPMMGKHISDLSSPITKGSSGILMLKKEKKKEDNCIQCSYCVDVCPMHLMPLKFAENYSKGRYELMEKGNLNSCIECAACQYICPSNVPLMGSIINGKSKITNN